MAVVAWWEGLTTPRPMNELDVIRVKETELATPWFEDDPIEINSRPLAALGRPQP
jgi:hypothetical protein